MEVWQPRTDDNAALIHPKRAEDWNSIDSFDGNRKPSFVPFEGTFMTDARTDFAYCKPGALFCNQRAWSILKGVVSNEVESLPFPVDGLPYFILNIINVVDCLDPNESVFKYFMDGKRIISGLATTYYLTSTTTVGATVSATYEMGVIVPTLVTTAVTGSEAEAEEIPAEADLVESE